MKKYLSLFLCVCFLLLCSCDFSRKAEEENVSKSNTATEITQHEAKEYRAVWLSYLELSFQNYSKTDFQKEIDSRFENIKNAGFNTIILHVRANCDAIYPSRWFPFSASFSGEQGVAPDYDPLQYMIDSAKTRGLSVEAWINPYRVSVNNNDITALCDTNPAKMWFEDQTLSNDKNVIIWDKGIYLDPASEEVRKLITDGISELLENYEIDGIQFDDYFYPTTDPKFDADSYNEYKSTHETYLDLEEWRRTNVSLLLSDCYKIVHKYEGKTFGISPAAAISTDKSDKNYSEYFADIYSWMSTEGYIDYIAPQLYFGYNYGEEAFKFDNLLKLWTDAKRSENVMLYIGLAPYKIGIEDSGSDEWIVSEGLLSRQISDTRKFGADGYLMYSYSGLFSNDERNKQELEAIKEMND